MKGQIIRQLSHSETRTVSDPPLPCSRRVIFVDATRRVLRGAHLARPPHKCFLIIIIVVIQPPSSRTICFIQGRNNTLILYSDTPILITHLS
jgi:hypothetical protein